MITIDNKQTALQLVEGKNATYGDLLAHLINRPTPGPIDKKGMRRDFRLMDLLEVNTKSFEVTEEDAKYLATLASESQWGGRHKDLLDFYDYFEALIPDSSN